ncbi:unnamed protein product, partial [Ectocarpus sp. 12 AP-2014]
LARWPHSTHARTNTHAKGHPVKAARAPYIFSCSFPFAPGNIICSEPPRPKGKPAAPSPGHFDGETSERPLRPAVCLLLRSTYCCRANTGRGNMVDREASSKRLEMRVKSLSSVTVAEEPNPSRDAATNMASPDVDHIGSMVGAEDAFPTGQMRRRVIDPPLGSKIGYHELEDEKEDADEEWMTGEASQVSGGGTRGSSNWMLKVVFPILLIAGIICMHNWWTDVKYHVSNAAKAVSDVFDRRALLEEEEAEGRGQGRFSEEEGAVSAPLPDKA